jgi:poly(beta-D-mannuronate) lyase
MGVDQRLENQTNPVCISSATGASNVRCAITVDTLGIAGDRALPAFDTEMRMNRPMRRPCGTGGSSRRYFNCAVLFVLVVVEVHALIAAPASPLRSPWDGKPVKATDAAYTCPAIAHIAPDLVTDGFYRLDDPTHSIVDPVRQEAYRKSSDSVKAVGMAIVKAADDYRASGSRQAAQCAIGRVLTMAQDKSLSGKMSSSQAYYVQGWVVGAIAVAYLKVRETKGATLAQNESIAKWLQSVGEQSKGYFDAQKKIHGNNHLYWAGVELAAIGVAADHRGDFDWAMETYDNGVDQIEPDGTLPLEMARGSKALHYHLYALAPLVLLAEFGEANGLDLYAHAHGSLHLLVNASVNGLRDPALFEKATGVKQEVPTVASGDQIGWAPPYARRFPNAELTRLIHAAPDLSVYYLGGLPPD